tara:strand:- start:3277 stop:4548 length:1272 start_codon:yes stop_codon:yes gene_type:complete
MDFQSKEISFKISEKEGLNYAHESKDFNKIHIDEKYAYNSLYKQKIVHGCLLFLKVLNKLKLKSLLKKNFKIKIIFFKPTKYNYKISLKIKKNKINIFQKNKIATILINKNLNEIDEKLNNVKFPTKINTKYVKNNLLRGLLNKTSEFVGSKENSLISSIEIEYSDSYLFSKNLTISSKKVSKNYPIILNCIKFREYKINFKSLIRPKLKIRNIKISKEVRDKVHNLRDNILIIGSSNGIGKDMLSILKLNKKIKVYSTYYNHEPLIKKNSFKLDIRLNKSINKIINIIKLNKSLIIYYFPTPKININENNYRKMDEYKKFYLNYPEKILSKINQNVKIKFFYPSTDLIDKKDNSFYTKIKLLAEKKLKRYNKNNIIINFLRIEKVNTVQNLGLLKQNLVSFLELLNKNKDYQKKIFFEGSKF